MFSTYSRQVDTAQWTSKLFNRGTYKSVKHREKVKVAKSQAAKGHKINLYKNFLHFQWEFALQLTMGIFLTFVLKQSLLLSFCQSCESNIAVSIHLVKSFPYLLSICTGIFGTFDILQFEISSLINWVFFLV